MEKKTRREDRIKQGHELNEPKFKILIIIIITIKIIIIIITRRDANAEEGQRRVS